MSTLAKKSDKDLVKLLKEKQEELRKVRFGVMEKRNPDAYRSLRKEIAQINTELNNR